MLSALLLSVLSGASGMLSGFPQPGFPQQSNRIIRMGTKAQQHLITVLGSPEGKQSQRVASDAPSTGKLLTTDEDTVSRLWGLRTSRANGIGMLH